VAKKKGREESAHKKTEEEEEKRKGEGYSPILCRYSFSSSKRKTKKIFCQKYSVGYRSMPGSIRIEEENVSLPVRFEEGFCSLSPWRRP